MPATTTYEPSGIATIAIGPRTFVRGVFVRRARWNRIVVRLGDRDFCGTPVGRDPRVDDAG